MASCSCGTRDKPKPVSPLSRGLWLLGCCMRLAFRNRADNSRCKALLVVMGLGRLSYIGRFLAGSNPSAWRRWLDLLDVRGSWLVWDGGIPRPPGRRPRPAASLRSLRAALENASRFLSSAPLRARIPPLAHKKAPWAVMGLGRSVLMAGTEGFEPPTAGTKNRSSTVELRPNVWCCPKATRLVYLICEGIANAVE